MQITCPQCASHFDLMHAIEDADGRRLLDLLKDIQPVVIRPYFRYLKLFKPAKQGLRWSRMLSLTQEIAPMIKAAQIERNHATYAVLPATWAEVMNELVDNPPATLKLPLKGHGYLLSILAASAEKHAAKAEQKFEDDRRRPREGVQHGMQQVASFEKPLEPNIKKVKRPPGWFMDKAYGKDKRKTDGDTDE